MINLFLTRRTVFHTSFDLAVLIQTERADPLAFVCGKYGLCVYWDFHIFWNAGLGSGATLRIHCPCR